MTKFKVVVLAVCFLLRLLKLQPNFILDYVKSRYGLDGVRKFRSCENSSRKLEKSKLDAEFLVKCKVYNITPKFLRFKLYRKCLHSSNFYKSWQSKLLSYELSSKRKTIATLTTSVRESESSLRESFSTFDAILCNRFIGQKIEEFKNSTIRTHEKKLRNLGVYNDLNPVSPDSVIFNFSSIVLTDRLKRALAFGLDFGLPNYRLDFQKYFLCFEKLIFTLRSSHCSNIGEFSHQLKSLAYKYYYNFKPSKIFSPVLSNTDIKSLRTLAKDESIVVSRPDKGRGVVIVDRVNYLGSMNKIISDRSKFKLISEPIHQFSLKMEDKINNFLRKLKKSAVISDDVYKRLFVSGSGPGTLYGLPKIHKPNFSTLFQFRPIFAAYNNPSFNIAKFLVPILAPLTRNEFTVDNTSSFIQDISTVSDANSYYMASFDIESLFTNIPLRETIDICLDALFRHSDSVMGFTRPLLKKLLELSVLNSFFMFDGSFYQQIEGLGMGLPLGPTFANIFMCFYEKVWLSDCPPHFKPIFYRRYIDDTFLLFRDKSHLPEFLNYLNAKHPNIKFTFECENNGTLSFLDTKISRENNNFVSSVYRKPTFTGLGLSFFSFCTFRFKINSIRTLLARAYAVSSNFTILHYEFVYLKDFFTKNGYPATLIDSVIKRFLSSKLDPCPLQYSVSKQPFYVSLPYFGSQSEKLKNELLSLLTKHFSAIDFNVILVNKSSIGSLFKHKDVLPISMQSSLIYHYCCARCASDYVGSTVRNLHMRVAEHAGRSCRTGSILASPPHSAIRLHSEQCDSPVSMNNFKIIGRASSLIELRILESLHIFRHKPVLNDTDSAFPLKIVNSF